MSDTKKNDHDNDGDDDAPSGRSRPRTATDVQKARLERLMKDPDKPVHIPTTRKQKDPNKAPEFVYNVMGSSAGAGSGEFHVYRQIRRKEMLRQRTIHSRGDKEDLDEAHQAKMNDIREKEEERTRKKREKRQKKKAAAKKKKVEGGKNKKQESSSESSSESEGEEEKKKE